MALSNRINFRGGQYSGPINTILTDLLGTYAGLATKTSAVLVPTILSGQKLRITGHNNVGTTYNYYVNIDFSPDGSNWVLLYTTNAIPFPTSGANTTFDVDLTSIIGNKGYFRIRITGDSRSNNSIVTAIAGTFN